MDKSFLVSNAIACVIPYHEMLIGTGSWDTVYGHGSWVIADAHWELGYHSSVLGTGIPLMALGAGTPFMTTWRWDTTHH